MWRDILVRYKNTVIGAAWYVTQPVAMTLIFILFMSRAFNSYMGDVPYPIFAYSGILLWTLFSRSISLGSSSLTMFEGILGKVFFPRIIAPLSAVAGTVFDFSIAGLVLIGMVIYYGITPSLMILLLPVIVALTLACALGFSCALAGLDSRYRDVRHLVPLLLQVWMFSSPIMYPSSYIPEKWQRIYELNPMVGLTDWFRWIMFGVGPEPTLRSLVVAAIISLASFALGTLFFQKIQGTVVDTI